MEIQLSTQVCQDSILSTLHALTHTYFVDTENTPAKKDFSWVTSLKFKTRVKQPLFTEVPYIYWILGRGHRLGSQASCTVLCLWVGPLLESSYDWNLINRTEPFPIQLAAISLFAFFSANQSSSIPITQDSAIWTKPWGLADHGNVPNHGQGVGTFLYISQLHLCVNGEHFQFPSKTELSWPKLQHRIWCFNNGGNHRAWATWTVVSLSWAVPQPSCFQWIEPLNPRHTPN